MIKGGTLCITNQENFLRTFKEMEFGILACTGKVGSTEKFVNDRLSA